MPEKSSIFAQIINQFSTIMFIVLISSFAGVIGYLVKIEKTNGKIRWQWLFVSFAVGGLNGYLVFLMCDLAGWPWQVTAIMTGASGAMGSECLHMMTRKFSSLIKDN